MGKNCAAYNCKQKYEKGISFHRFPQDKKVEEKWIVAMKIDRWKPTKYSLLCSRHFTSEDFEQSGWSSIKKLKNDAVPSIFDYSIHIKKEKKESSFSELLNHPVPTETLNIKTENFESLQNMSCTADEEISQPEFSSQHICYPSKCRSTEVKSMNVDVLRPVLNFRDGSSSEMANSSDELSSNSDESFQSKSEAEDDSLKKGSSVHFEYSTSDDEFVNERELLLLSAMEFNPEQCRMIEHSYSKRPPKKRVKRRQFYVGDFSSSGNRALEKAKEVIAKKNYQLRLERKKVARKAKKITKLKKLVNYLKDQISKPDIAMLVKDYSV